MSSHKYTSPKTWLITGASSGIGYRTCQQLLEAGHIVIALIRDPQKLSALAAVYPDRLKRLILDLSDRHAVQNIIPCIWDEAQSIDVILHAAGYALVGAVEEMSEDQIERAIRVNFTSAITLIKGALPFLRERRNGHIIYVSSEGGQMSYPGASVYHACKWGMEGFCESLSQEIRPFNLHLTIIEPGRVKTDFDANAILADNPIDDYRRTTLGRYLKLLQMGRFPAIGDPDKVASAIIGVTQTPEPPLRLALGSDSYRNIHTALRQRMEQLAEYAETSHSTDFSTLKQVAKTYHVADPNDQ